MTNERLAGQTEAWELARRIDTNTPEGLSTKELVEIFGAKAYCGESLFKIFSYSEAAEKVKKWEESKKEIHVGDEFEAKSGNRGVVTRVDVDRQYICILWDDGSAGQWEICKFRQKFTKTNKTYPVENLLNQMRGENIE